MFIRFKAIVPAIILISGLALPASAQQDFTFASPDGGTVAVSGMRGNVVVLVFSSVQDPQCRDIFKAMESLTERYGGKNVRIYWVSIDLEKDASNEQIKNPCGPAGKVAVLRDPARAAFKSFGGRQMPTTVVLDKQGQLHGQPRGGFNPNSDFVNKMAAVIDSLLGQN
ncbi:MAG: TlpA family protein disulfide reductase [Blastocatellia bacterium]|nr:TlpA family protein disulfide reductase [Blastocatellia bacterium]